MCKPDQQDHRYTFSIANVYPESRSTDFLSYTHTQHTQTVSPSLTRRLPLLHGASLSYTAPPSLIVLASFNNPLLLPSLPSSPSTTTPRAHLATEHPVRPAPGPSDVRLGKPGRAAHGDQLPYNYNRRHRLGKPGRAAHGGQLAYNHNRRHRLHGGQLPYNYNRRHRLHGDQLPYNYNRRHRLGKPSRAAARRGCHLGHVSQRHVSQAAARMVRGRDCGREGEREKEERGEREREREEEGEEGR
jgi:hypothetical protein